VLHAEKPPHGQAHLLLRASAAKELALLPTLTEKNDNFNTHLVRYKINTLF
jgi:hypothetical protein